MARPILRETIKKLRARRAQLERQVKGPLEELRQIDDDLKALEAAAAPARRAPAGAHPAGRAPARRAPAGANQAAILRAIRNGATTPDEVAERARIPASRVNSSLTSYINRQKLVT